MWSRRPSPALIVATVALVVAMAGTTYAATQLPKNSVGAKQLKKDAVTGAKVKNGSLTGSDIDVASLGNVPSASNSERANLADRALTADSVGTAKTAQNADHAATAGHATTADTASEADHATSATSAETVPQAGPIRIVGAAGQPPFLNGSENRVLPEGEYQSVGFYKDGQGIVHLEGVVKPGTVDPLIGLVFELPVGYRPATGKFVAFQPTSKQSVLIGGTGTKLQTVNTSGMVFIPGPEGEPVPLGGISFLAQG
jgi:hypothetical protein